MSSYKQLTACRICGNTELRSVIHLGDQTLTGVFPKIKATKITKGPLELVKCDDENNPDACGLLQLNHTFNHDEMYGDNYGYRSGLNGSMVAHLQAKVAKMQSIAKLNPNDIILDIGSNDATSLRTYPDIYRRIGIDPTAAKFQSFYTGGIDLVPDFFSADNFRKIFPTEKAKIVSSIAMFYDLEQPMDFMKNIYDILDDEGLWVCEQSYMPSMLTANAYDTICHEHLEYYSLKQMKWMADRVGFKIVDVTLNDINGGSFEVICAKKESSYLPFTDKISLIEKSESDAQFHKLSAFDRFVVDVQTHRDELIEKLAELKAAGKKVIGYGASTKGNVILQYCNFTEADLSCIAEVNPDKFGSFTPQTLIPIVSEADAKAGNPDYMLVLPWHFKENIIGREQAFLKAGGKLLFPLPYIHEVGA